MSALVILDRGALRVHRQPAPRSAGSRSGSEAPRSAGSRSGSEAPPSAGSRSGSEGSTVTIATADAATRQPVWSADGALLAWSRFDRRSSDGVAQVIVVDIDHSPNDRLELDVTVEDAKAYTRPWTVRINYRLVPDQQLIEFVCNENEQSSKHYVTK